jgi:hypothetical protein
MSGAPGPYSSPWGTPPPPPTAPRSRRNLAIAIAAVVIVVVVLLAALLVSGALSSKSNGNPADATYSQAAGAVSSYAAGYKGGGWKMIVASGLDSSVATVSPPINGSSLDSLTSTGHCTDSVLIAAGSTITLPSFAGNRSSGESPFWAFVLYNSNGTFLAVEYNQGTVTPLATVDCAELALVTGFLSPIPSTVIDSSVAASTAWSAGGATFMATNPGATEEFALIGGIDLGSAAGSLVWTVSYQACDPSSTTSADVPTFTARINATESSANLLSANNTTSPCGTIPSSLSGGLGSIGGGLGNNGGITSLSSVLTFGSPVVESSGAGTFVYSIPVATVTGTIAWQGLDPLITTADGTAVEPTSWNLTVEGTGGTPLLVYNLTSPSFGWSSPNVLDVAVGQTVWLNASGTDLTGDTLELISDSVTLSGEVGIPNL